MFGPPPRDAQRTSWINPLRSGEPDRAEPPPPPPPPRWWGHHEKNTAKPPRAKQEPPRTEPYGTLNRHRKLDQHAPRAYRPHSWQPDTDWRTNCTAPHHAPAWRAPLRPWRKNAVAKERHHPRPLVAWCDDDPGFAHPPDEAVAVVEMWETRIPKPRTNGRKPATPRPRQAWAASSPKAAEERAVAKARPPPVPKPQAEERAVAKARPPPVPKPQASPSRIPRPLPSPGRSPAPKQAAAVKEAPATNSGGEEVARWQALMPPGWTAVGAPDGHIYFWHTASGAVSWDPPRPAPPPPQPPAPPPPSTGARRTAHQRVVRDGLRAALADADAADAHPAQPHDDDYDDAVSSLLEEEEASSLGDAVSEPPSPSAEAPRPALLYAAPPVSPGRPPAGVPSFLSGGAPVGRAPGVRRVDGWVDLGDSQPTERERRVKLEKERRREEATSAWERAQCVWVDRERERADKEEAELAAEAALFEGARVRSEACRRQVAETRRAETEASDAVALEAAQRVWRENCGIASRNRARLTGDDRAAVGSVPEERKLAASPSQGRYGGLVSPAAARRRAAPDGMSGMIAEPTGAAPPTAARAVKRPPAAAATAAAAAAAAPPPPHRPPEVWSIDLDSLPTAERVYRKPALPRGTRRARPSLPVTVVASDWPPPERAAAAPEPPQEPASPVLEEEGATVYSRAASPDPLPSGGASLAGGGFDVTLRGEALMDAMLGFPARPAYPYALSSGPTQPKPSDAAPLPVSPHAEFLGSSASSALGEPDAEPPASVLDAVDSFLSGAVASHFLSSD